MHLKHLPLYLDTIFSLLLISILHSLHMKTLHLSILHSLHLDIVHLSILHSLHLNTLHLSILHFLHLEYHPSHDFFSFIILR